MPKQAKVEYAVYARQRDGQYIVDRDGFEWQEDADKYAEDLAARDNVETTVLSYQGHSPYSLDKYGNRK